MSKPVLGYWKVRGLAQPIRLLLNYVGQEFEEELYVQGDGPDFSRECWTSVKYNLNLEFPNLPYFIDGDLRLTQSNVILRYLARKYKLYGATDAEKVRVDLMTEVLMDLRNSITRLCYDTPQGYESRKVEYSTKYLPDTLKSIEKFLGSEPWLAGDNLTFVDFILHEQLDALRLMLPDCLNDSPQLRAFKERFEALPAIKRVYTTSPDYLKYPIINKVAMYMFPS